MLYRIVLVWFAFLLNTIFLRFILVIPTHFHCFIIFHNLKNQLIYISIGCQWTLGCFQFFLFYFAIMTTTAMNILETYLLVYTCKNLSSIERNRIIELWGLSNCVSKDSITLHSLKQRDLHLSNTWYGQTFSSLSILWDIKIHYKSLLFILCWMFK